MAGTLLGLLGIGITADLSGLSKGLDTASKSLVDFGKKTTDMGKSISATGVTMTKWITGPILALGAGMLALVTKTANYADELLDLESQTGLTTDSLQEWRHVAEMAGVGADTVANAVMGLTRRLPQLAQEGSMSAEQMAKLGLSFADLEKLSPDELIDTLIDRLSAMEDPMERNAIGAKLFGGAWIEMAPILDEGAEGIEKLREEAHKLGIVMSKEGLESADAFRKEWVKVKEQFGATFRELGVNLMPMLQTKLFPFVKNTLVPAIEKLVKVIVDVVTWFGKLPAPVQNAIIGLGIFLAAIGPITVAIGGMIQGIGALTAAFGTLTAFMAANPIVLAILGVAAAVAGVVLVADAIKGVHDRAVEARQKVDELRLATEDLGTSLAISGNSADILTFSLNLIGSALSELTFGLGEMSQITFEDLTARLDDLKASVLELPKDQMAAAWKQGVLDILDEVDELVPGVKKIMDDVGRTFTTELTVQEGYFRDSYGNIVNIVDDARTKIEEDATAIAKSEEVAAAAKAAADAAQELFDQYQRGITPTYMQLYADISALGVVFYDLFQKGAEGTIDYANALQALVAKRGEVAALLELPGLSDVGRNQILQLMEWIDRMTGAWDAAKVATREGIQAAKDRMDQIRAEMGLQQQQADAERSLAEQTALEARADADLAEAQAELARQRAAQTAAIMALRSNTAGYATEIDRLEKITKSETASASEKATAYAGLDQILAQLKTEYDRLVMAGDPAAKSILELAEAAATAGGRLDEDLKPALQDAADALDDAKKSAAAAKAEFESWGGSLLTIIDRVKSFAVAVKSQLVSSLSDLGFQLATFNRTREEEEAVHEANLQKIRDDASLDTQAKLEAALLAEETRFEENKTTLKKIFDETWQSFTDAILKAGIDTAAQAIVDMLWNVFVPGVASAVNAANAAFSTLLVPIAAVAGALAVISDILSGRANIAGSIGEWLDNLFGFQHGLYGTVGSGQPVNQYASGGIVSGAMGQPQLAVVHGGEPIGAKGFAQAMDYGAFAEAVQAGVYDAMSELGMGADRPMILQVDGKTFGRIALPLVQREKVRLGLEAV